MFIDADNATASNRFKFGTNGESLLGSNAQTSSPSTANATFDMFIGSRIDGGLKYVGYFQEIIFFNTDKASLRALIEDNINDYFNIYS